VWSVLLEASITSPKANTVTSAVIGPS